MFAAMSIREAYRHFLLQLQEIYALGEATAITDRVFESLCDIRKTDLIKAPQQPIEESKKSLLATTLTALQNHQPVQYVLGEAWFGHLKLKVNRHVLIPRPETEELVETILDDLRKIYQLREPGNPRKTGMVHILDIGTGSGCIPIALKKAWPAAQITAIDTSAEALLLARENASFHHCDISFQQLDFLDEKAWDTLPQFDIIVSNPPYIPEKDKEILEKNVVDWEPHLALFVPENGPLLFYRKIAAFAKTHLLPGGKIYLELHSPLAAETAELFRRDYTNISLKKDLSGLERMLVVS